MKPSKRWLASLLAALMLFGLVLTPAFTVTAAARTTEPTVAAAPLALGDPEPAPVTHIVRFFNWDNTPLGQPQTIVHGESAVAPPVPSRDGWRFTAWSADFSAVTQDMDIQAQFVQLVSFTVTINYVFANATLARQPVVFSVEAGGSLVQSVPTVAIAGYQADQAGVEINLANVQANATYTVTYSPAANTPYRVLHYLQKLALVNPGNPMDPANFDLADTDDKTAPTGALATAVAKAYTGFSAPAAMPAAMVAAGGGTVLQVYYTRNQYAIYFDSSGGSFVPPIAAPYGAAVAAPPNPTRPGYTFDKWSAAVPGTMPAGDVTLTALWKTPATVGYTLVYWLENITGTGYDYVGAAAASGTAGTAPAVPGTVPGGVTFPIGGDYYAQNAAKTNAEKPAAISGDGTTIVNVYCDRKSYTVNFVFNAAKYTVAADGATITASPYQLTAKYGAPISTKWPAAPALKSGQQSDGTFTGWLGGSETYVTTQFYLGAGLIGDSPLTAQFDRQSKNVTVYYMFQNVTGGGYTAMYTQTVATGRDTDSWTAKPFEGFTVQQSTVPITSNTATFNYTRNQYKITYYNGGAAVNTVSSIPYGTPIGGPAYNYTPTRPASVPAGYTFAGWYTTAQGYDNSRFSFAGATMPAANLILYARWDRPVYTVTFVPDNGAASFTQAVVAQGTATEPAAPAKPGYVFGGWYLPGASTHYVFNFPVTQNITLTARWVAANNVTYNVVYMKAGAEVLRQSFGGHMVGDTVTASAIAIAGYLPDALSKSLILAAGGNQIVFNYSPFTAVGYTVRYRLAEDPDIALAPDKQASTGQASVTENYVNVSGYSPNYYQQTLQLTPNAADNLITFLYTPNAQVPYTVLTLLENVNGGYATSSETKYTAAGSVINETPPAYTGFTYQPGLSTNGRVAASNGSTVIRLYYNRNQYTVTFGAQGSGTLSAPTSFGGIRYETPFGAAATVPAAAPAPGYRLDRWEPQLPLGTAPVTADADYTAVFVKDPAQWATITYSANGGTGSMAASANLLIGQSFTLPANTFTRANNVYTNWNTGALGGGTAYGDGETITVAGDMTLYAQWSPDEDFGVVYLPCGGSGTTADPARYFEGAQVTVLANGFTRPGYQFTGWTVQDTGTVYQPGDKFFIRADTVLKAGWALDEDQWTTIQYDKNNADATGAMAAEKVLANLDHALSPNAFARPNYSFTGWSTAPGTAAVDYADGATLRPAPGGGTLRLYAQWQENTKVTVTYKSNNPADATLADAPRYRGAAATVFAASTFLYQHFDFIRWNTQPDGLGTTYLPGDQVFPTEDLTLYAVWKQRAAYTVTYLDGFSPDGDPQATLLYADADGLLDLTVAANPYVRPGYQFVDWQDGAGIHAGPGAVRLDLSADITFTAQWGLEQYHIAYDLGGGAVNGVNPTQYTIETVSFDLVSPARPGYTFEGWTGTGLAGSTLNVSVPHGSRGDRAYTANWTRDDSQWVDIFFFNSNSAQGSLSGLLRYQGVIGQPTAGAAAAGVAYPALTPLAGFIFSHWSAPIPSVFPEADLIITAFWASSPGASGSSPAGSGSTPGGGSSSGSAPSPSSGASSASAGGTSSSAASSSSEASPSSSASVPAASTSGGDSQNSAAGGNPPAPPPAPGGTTWALLDLLAAIAGVAAAIALVAGLFTKRGRQARKAGGPVWPRVLAIAAGAALAVLFLLTQDLSGAMVPADMWTPAMLLVLLAQALLALWLHHIQKPAPSP